MSKLGGLGDVVFEVTDANIITFKSLQQNKRGRYSTLNVANYEQLLQYQGKELRRVSFKMPFHHRFCNPMEEIQTLHTMVDEHKAHPLIVGGWVLGEFVVEEIDDSWNVVADNGVVMSAEINVGLREYK